MKRQIVELRRVLLEVEACGEEPVRYHRIGHPVGYYHAWLLYDGGFVRGVWFQSDLELIVDSLTSKGHDLLDNLRDEKTLELAQDSVQAQGYDRDYLEMVLKVSEKLRDG